MLSKNASKAAVIRTVNDQGSPVGSGMLGSGSSRSVPEPDTYNTPWSLVGVITDTGPYGSEPNYNNSNYWVQIQSNASYFNSSAGADTLPIQFFNASAGADFTGTTINDVLTAFNPPDVANQTHALAVGTPVTIVPVYMDVPQPDANGNPVGASELVRWCIAGVPSGPQPFNVASLPNASGGVVSPYCTCKMQSSNGALGTILYSVAVTVPHGVGDPVYAQQVGIVVINGTNLVDANNDPVTWKEDGQYRVGVETGLNQSGGSNVSAGTIGFPTLTYIPLAPDGTPLAPAQVVQKPRLIPTGVTAATKGKVYIDPAKNPVWIIEEAWEDYGGGLC